MVPQAHPTPQPGAGEGESPEAPADERAEVLAAVGGDPQAFAVLVRRSQRAALRVAVALTEDFELAEDAVQEAFLAAYADLRRFDPGRPFLPWLLGVVAHRALAARRARRRRAWREWPLDPLRRLAAARAGGTAPPRPTDASGPSPLDGVLRDEEVREVWEAVARLSPKLRQAVVLHYFGDLPVEAVAVAADTPPGTVKSRLHAARRALAGFLGGAARTPCHRGAGAPGTSGEPVAEPQP